MEPARPLCAWRFSRKENWNALPCPPTEDLSHQVIKPTPPALQVDSLPSEPPRKPENTGVSSLSLFQDIFLTQESNWGLLHYRRILYQLSYQRSEFYRIVIIYWLWRKRKSNRWEKLIFFSSGKADDIPPYVLGMRGEEVPCSGGLW